MYADLLAEAMWHGVSINRYWQLSPAAARCLVDCECNTTNRVSMWCAQTGHESCGLYYMEEVDWNGDNYAYLEGREDLGNIYPGDGARFHGRGPIQVTGRDNYTRCSQWCFEQGFVPSPTFFVDFPHELASDVNGFHGVTWYWTTQRPMNDAADAGDIDLATYYINGGYNGLEDRTNRWNACLGMGDRIMGLTDQQAAGEGPQLMGEVMLNFDHNIIPQETGYWCGPASCQVALSCQGIWESEQQLANEMGTDQGGTDYVALIERSLDPRLPAANYSSHDAPNDPPTQHQKDAFWDALKRSVDNGFAVVMNWVSPEGNHPVGIKGTASPDYNGTIYHYVTAVGYDDNPNQRAVWVADSGWWPWTYWITFDQCCTLLPPKAFCYANLPHVDGGEDDVVSDTDRHNYEQLCGLIDPNTGYGTGWPQNGQNEHGQNLYTVDVLGRIIAEIDGTEYAATEAHPQQASAHALDYGALTLDQLAGPVGPDAQRHGWPQLGDRSLNDAAAYIKDSLSSEPPPFRENQESPAESPPADPPSSPSPEPGPPPAPATRRTWRDRL